MKFSSIAILTAAVMGSSAVADTINSFTPVTAISGITVTPSYGSPILSYTVTLNAGAFFTLGGTDYFISDITTVDLMAFGFNDLNQPALAPFGTWVDASDHKPAGSLYGWSSTNANNGIHVGESVVFNFPSIDFTHYTQFGFHVRLSGDQIFPGTTGNTGSIYLVPAPGATALLSLAGVVGGRRRRRA